MRLTVIVLAMSLVVQTPSVSYFRKGSGLVREAAQWEKYSRGERPEDLAGISYFQGYVVGVLDAEGARIKTPEGFTVDQACAIVAKFIRDHPERLNEPGADLVRHAVRKAYPPR